MAQDNRDKVEWLSPQQAYARMRTEGERVILDVRQPAEYAEEHIPGAVLLPLGRLQARAAEVLPDKDAEILVYCRSGQRSAQAALWLAEMGYTHVGNFGGIMSWPYETEGSGE